MSLCPSVEHLLGFAGGAGWSEDQFASGGVAHRRLHRVPRRAVGVGARRRATDLRALPARHRARLRRDGDCLSRLRSAARARGRDQGWCRRAPGDRRRRPHAAGCARPSPGAKVNHPNVCHVYDVGTEGDEVWVAMELIDGVTLRQFAGERRTEGELVRRAARCGKKGSPRRTRSGIIIAT